MAFRKSINHLRSLCIIILGLSSFEAFAVPPIPDWARTRWVNTSQSKKVQEVTDPSLLYHDPKCAPFLCIRQKKRRKITWNPEEMRISNQGVQAIARRNYKLREEVRMRWLKKD